MDVSYFLQITSLSHPIRTCALLSHPTMLFPKRGRPPPLLPNAKSVVVCVIWHSPEMRWRGSFDGHLHVWGCAPLDPVSWLHRELHQLVALLTPPCWGFCRRKSRILGDNPPGDNSPGDNPLPQIRPPPPEITTTTWGPNPNPNRPMGELSENWH